MSTAPMFIASPTSALAKHGEQKTRNSDRFGQISSVKWVEFTCLFSCQ